MAQDNKSLGKFTLDGIPPAPRGVPQIEVTFDMDTNGILKVSAKDKATGREQSIKITGAVGLSDEEVKKAQEEAEKYVAEDQAKKEQVEARNQADALVFTAEKTLKDAGDKAPQDVKEKVETEVKNVKEALAKEGATKEEIEGTSKKLSEVLQEVGQAMYGSAGSPQDQGQEQAQQEQASGGDSEPAEEETKKKKTKAKDHGPAEGAEEGEVVG